MGERIAAVRGWIRENNLIVLGAIILSAILYIQAKVYHPDPHIETALDSLVVISTPEGEGSGFFVSPDGCMLTASHVVTDSSGTVLPIRVRLHGEILSYRGEVIHADPFLDIAYACIIDGAPPAYLHVVNTESIKRGSRIYALGDTMGRTWSVSEGVVSRTGYKLHMIEGNQSMQQRYALWITAFISWGNSGGPVIDDHGDVVGMVVEWDDPARAGHPNGMNIAVNGTDLLRFIRTVHGE